MKVTLSFDVVEQDDLKNALRHAMTIEHSVSRSEMHKGLLHEAASRRYARYERLYVKVDQAGLE